MKKLKNQILMILTLFSVIGLFSSGIVKAASPEVVRVTIDELTKVQKDSIQSGDLTAPAKEGERILYVYAYDQQACPLSPVLPNTGTSSTILIAVAGTLMLTGAAYFLVTNKKGKKMILMAGLVVSGLAAGTTIVSANESLENNTCYKYVGYIREGKETTTVENTSVETTVQTELTTESTIESTTESTAETTTTTESSTEETTHSEILTVAPTDYLG